MAKLLRFSAALPVLAVSVLMAQQGQVAGPVSGYVFDRMAHMLRPVLGIAGASVLGDGVNFGMPVASVYVSPRQDSAIVFGSDRSQHVFTIQSGVAKEVAANGLAGLSEGVAFSPSGSAAVLFAAGRVQVITGLPGAPVLGPVVDARSQEAITVRPHHYRLMATE